MKKLAFTSMLALVLLSVPAVADDFLGTCKANPAGASQAANDKWCACVDKETAGNDKVRALFMAAFKLSDLEKRKASSSDPSFQSIGSKCNTQ